jgi:PIN domain nuclease of toxin-antitoxin system
VKALLDTHVLLWWLSDSSRLSTRVHTLLADPGSELFWSAASSWELAIKVARGRLRLPAPLQQLIPAVMRDQALVSLPVEHVHTFEVGSLPPVHRDPFDRLLVAQARVEGMPLVSVDDRIREYDVDVIW